MNAPNQQNKVWSPGTEDPGSGEFYIEPNEGTYLVIRRDAEAFFVIPRANAGAAVMPFTPTTPENWTTSPTTIQAALDGLAARVSLLG